MSSYTVTFYKTFDIFINLSIMNRNLGETRVPRPCKEKLVLLTNLHVEQRLPLEWVFTFAVSFATKYSALCYQPVQHL